MDHHLFQVEEDPVPVSCSVTDCCALIAFDLIRERGYVQASLTYPLSVIHFLHGFLSGYSGDLPG